MAFLSCRATAGRKGRVSTTSIVIFPSPYACIALARTAVRVRPSRAARAAAAFLLLMEALNITRDSSLDFNDEVAANVNGNTLVNYNLQSGINKVIGKKADKLRNRNYEFIWNSNGYNTILYYDVKTNTRIKVFQSKTDSNNIDILAWNPNYKINHVDIIYRDEGDLVFWTEGLNNPSQIDVTKAVSGWVS